MHSAAVDAVLAFVVVGPLTESGWSVWKNENDSHTDTTSARSLFCRLCRFWDAKVRVALRCGQAIEVKLDQSIWGWQSAFGWISSVLVLEFDFDQLRTRSPHFQTLTHELTFWRRLLYLAVYVLGWQIPWGTAGLCGCGKCVLRLLSCAQYSGCCCLTVPYVVLERSLFLG